MSGSRATCPSCGDAISWRTVPVEFQCASCGTWLKLTPGPERYVLLALVLVAAIAGALTTGPMRALSSALAAALLLFRLAQFLGLLPRILKPGVGWCDGAAAVVRRPPIPVTTGTRAIEPRRADSVQDMDASGKHRRGLFEFPDPPHTLEGLTLIAVVVLIVGTRTLAMTEPLITWLYPVYHATKVGPDGFPVTLHIGRKTLGVTNRSDQRWDCALTLGRRQPGLRLGSTIVVKPHAREELPYVLFKAADGQATPDEGERAARERISVRCREASGRSHYRTF